MLRVEIFNEGQETTFVGSQIQGTDNALSQLRLNLFLKGKLVDSGRVMSAADYLRYRDDDSRKPPLADEFSKYWIALSPGTFYGGQAVIRPNSFETLSIPGKYMVRGTYVSDGFLHAGMNNPLASYVNELSHLPFQAWTGEIESNSIWIEVVKPAKKKQ